MQGSSDRIFLAFGLFVLMLALLSEATSAASLAHPWSVALVLMATAGIEGLLTLLSGRLGRQAVDRTIRILLLGAVALVCTRLGDFLHSSLWVICAMPAVAMALFWRGVVAAACSLGLFLAILVAAVLLHPPGGPSPTLVDVLGLALRLAVLWACVLLLNLLLDASRRHQSRRRAEAERTVARQVRLEAILDALGAAVLVVDHRGWIRRTNGAMATLTGRSAAQLEGLLVDAVVHLGWAESPDDPVERVGRSEIPVAGGEPIPVAYRVAPLDEGRDHLVSLHDLRSQYAAMSDLAQRSAALRERGVTQSRFLASVGHQLRTPMDAVVEEVGQLLGDDSLTQQQRRHLTVVRRNADLLLELVDDMLLICRIDGGLAEPQLDEISVLRLLREAGIPRSPELQAIAATGQLPTVQVDRLWMDRVFMEIIDAQPFIGGPPLRVEHSVVGQTYQLHVPSRRFDGKMDDTFVFGPHFPEHEGASSFAASRLGLALARLQVRALDGDLSVGPNSGGQPGFVLTLPVAGVRSF